MAVREPHGVGCEPWALPELGEHGPRFDRSQLIAIPKQNQTRVKGHGRKQARHHFEVNHGRLVHHHHIRGQGMVLGHALQQPMQGLHVSRNVRAHGLGQILARLGNRFTQARRGFACGRGKMNAQRARPRALAHEQEGQQAHHRGGLARARPARDQAHAGMRRQATRLALLRTVGEWRKERLERIFYRLGRLWRGLQAREQRRPNALLGLPSAS